MSLSFLFITLQYRFSERNTRGLAHKTCDLMNAHANCSRVNPLYRKNPAAANGAAARMHTQLAVSLPSVPFVRK